MKELNEHTNDMSMEVDDMTTRLDELRVGIGEQVHSVLSVPPPPILYKKNYFTHNQFSATFDVI